VTAHHREPKAAVPAAFKRPGLLPVGTGHRLVALRPGSDAEPRRHAIMLDRRTATRIATVLAAGALTVLGTATPGTAAGRGPEIPVVKVSSDSTGIHGPDVMRRESRLSTRPRRCPATDSMAIVRLDDGVSYDEILGYLASGDLPDVFANVSGKGGIAHAREHNGGRWTTTLTIGNYLYVDDAACLLPPFQVARERQHAPRPTEDGTVLYANGTFLLPAGFGSGPWRLHNGDTMSHGLGIIHVAPGRTRSEVSRAMADGERPAWLEPQGTVNILGLARPRG